MEITKVGVIGAGAIGAYFLWGMRELPREDICLIVKGERKERLIRNGIIINGERYDYPVKEPQEAGKVDLLLVATKYGALSSILKDAQAVVDFFAKTTCKCTFKPDIITEMWYKYAINISRNLPQAVLGVGVGAYDDSEHVEFISHRLWDEVDTVAKAKGITISPYGFAHSPRKNAHLSTLQDLMAGRHTEIDMFAGTMVRMGRELGIPVPYCEYTFHAIKALEEKNIKFDCVSGASSGSIIATLYALGYNSDEMWKMFQKYYKKIKYAEWKQIFKLILGLLFKGELVIDGLNSGKSIEKIMSEICRKSHVENINQIKMPLFMK